MKTLIAFNGNASLKEAMIREVKKHEKADAILQGTYGRQNGTWKGCAVACSLRSLAIIRKEDLVTEYNQHTCYETGFGIPRITARLEERIFEGLSPNPSKKFPLRFMQAVNVGANLELVWPNFVVWLLVDKKDGIIKYARNDSTKKVIRKAADLYSKIIVGERVKEKTWKALRDAIDVAAADAVYVDLSATATARDVAAAIDADAVDYAADTIYAATRVTYAINVVVKADTARAFFYSRCANKLIEILKTTKANQCDLQAATKNV